MALKTVKQSQEMQHVRNDGAGRIGAHCLVTIAILSNDDGNAGDDA